MKKSLLFFTLSSLVILSFGVCAKSNKVDESEIRPQENAPSGPTLLFTLDGSIKDWNGIEPLWNEGGAEGRGVSEHNVDIKQVYFKNDDQYLYVFMRCTPTIAERYKITPYSDIMGDLYFDIDNDPATGSGKLFALDELKGEEYKGYEVRVWIPIGVMSSSKGKTPCVAYEIRSLDNAEFSHMSDFTQNSFSSRALIAHGKDGIEFALPLDKLGLQSPKTIRVLLREQSHFSQKEGYTIGLIDLE